MARSLSPAAKRNPAILAACAAILALALLACASPAHAAGYKQTDEYYHFSNGARTVYMESSSYSNVLYVLDNATGSAKQLRTFKHGQDDSWYVTYAYKNIVFITHNQFDKWRSDTYAYNMKTKKLKKAKGTCHIVASNGGKYVVGENTYRTDVGPTKLTLYKVNGKGEMKKVKTLAKHGFGAAIVGKYIYFGSGNDRMSKMKVYRCKLNGKSKKKLGGTWKGPKLPWGGRGMVLPQSFTKTNCIVSFSGSETKNYLYTYKTKKLKRLSNEEYYALISS